MAIVDKYISHITPLDSPDTYKLKAYLLKNGRTFKVKLNSANASTAFDGSANITDIGVSGILGTVNGGTGNDSFTKDTLIYANTATKLASYTSTKGGTKKLWYLNAGVPTDSTETVGDNEKPVYLNAGTITAGLPVWTLANPTQFIENESFNDKTSIGNYYISANTIAATIPDEGKPETGSIYGTLKVSKMFSGITNANYLRHDWFAHNSAKHFTRRTNSSAEWSGWSAYAYIPPDITTQKPADIGGTEQPTYVKATGELTPTAYHLKASIESGTQNRAAYYSDIRKIEDAGSIYMTASTLGVNQTSITSGQTFEVTGKAHIANTTANNGTTATPPAFSVGTLTGTNIGVSPTGIQAKNNATTSTLNLNYYGSPVVLGQPSTPANTTINGILTIDRRNYTYTTDNRGTLINLINMRYNNAGGSKYYEKTILAAIATNETDTTVDGASVFLGSQGGALVLGAGESPATVQKNNDLNSNKENIYLIADGGMLFYTNADNARHKVTIDSNGLTVEESYLRMRPYSATYNVAAADSFGSIFFNHDRENYPADTFITGNSIRAAKFIVKHDHLVGVAPTAAKTVEGIKWTDNNNVLMSRIYSYKWKNNATHHGLYFNMQSAESTSTADLFSLHADDSISDIYYISLHKRINTSLNISATAGYTANGENGAGSTLYNNGVLYLNSTVGSWTYTRLNNGTYLWDIATKSNDNTSSLQFRNNSSGSNTTYVRFDLDGSIYTGNLTIGGKINTDAGKTIISSSTLYLKTSTSSSIIFNTDSTNRARFDPSGHFKPESTNTYTLGISGTRWKSLFVGTADSYGGITQPIWWNAGVPTAITTAIATAYGGTGNTSYTAHRLIYTNTATKLATGTIESDGNNIILGDGDYSLSRTARGGNWNQGVSKALIKITSATEAYPLFAMKSHSGYWLMTQYENNDFQDHLMFGFLSDVDIYGVTNAKNHYDYKVRLIPTVYATNTTTVTDRAFVTANYASDSAQTGGTEQPVYVDTIGVVKNTTYHLKAHIEDGSANCLAYYSAARTIDYVPKITYFTYPSTDTTNGPVSGSSSGLIITETSNGGNAGLKSGNEALVSYGDSGPQIRFKSSDTGILLYHHYDTASDGGAGSFHFLNSSGVATVMAGGFTSYASSGDKTGFRLRDNTDNTSYGFMRMATRGTTSAVGNGELTLGNSISQGTAGNARGSIYLYATNTHWTGILAQGNGDRTFYLPNYAGDMYAIHAGNNNAVGSTTQPVYAAANGRLTAITGAIANDTTGNAATATAANITSTDNAIVRFNGTAGAFQNSKAFVNDNGSITAGTWTANTATSAEIDVKAASGAGTIYLYSAKTITGDRGIWLQNAGGESSGSKGLLVVNQDNNITTHAPMATSLTVAASNTYNLGASGTRWKAAFIGTADSYGSATNPIYWNNGIPVATNPFITTELVHYCDQVATTLYYVTTSITVTTSSNYWIYGTITGTKGTGSSAGMDVRFQVYWNKSTLSAAYYQDSTNAISEMTFYTDSSHKVYFSFACTRYSRVRITVLINNAVGNANYATAISTTAPATFSITKEAIEVASTSAIKTTLMPNNSTAHYILGVTGTAADSNASIIKAYRTSTAQVYFRGDTGVLMGAAWNDYAEYRQAKNDIEIEPGRVVKEVGDETLELTTERLQRGCSIVSNTFGISIGESDINKLPLAVSGRVLAYPYEDREEFKNHIGWPVCSGPNGTVSIMTEKEEIKYPSRIIGIISAVPNYEIWHGGADVIVDGRVWIKVR